MSSLAPVVPGKAKKKSLQEQVSSTDYKKKEKKSPVNSKKKSEKSDPEPVKTKKKDVMMQNEEKEDEEEENEEEEEDEKETKKKKPTKNKKKGTKKKKKRNAKTYYKALRLTVNLDTKVTEIGFTVTTTMVVDTVTKKSPFWDSLVVGDQILEINGTVPMKPTEIGNCMIGKKKFKIRIVRPWNVLSIGTDREDFPVKNDHTYRVVHLPKYKPNQGHLSVEFKDKKAVITNVGKLNSLMSNTFFIGDRILDVNKKKVPQTERGIVDEYTKTLNKDGFCTFLVEREQDLRSSPNPSLCVVVATFENARKLGDDACEIGAREATRWNAMKDKYSPTSIMKAGAGEEEEVEDKKAKKEKTKKKKSLSVDEEKNKEFQVPTDVKNIANLERVTPKSGLTCIRARHAMDEKEK